MKNQATHGTGGPRPPDDPEQSKRFEEKARELGTDETGKIFERALKTTTAIKSRAKNTHVVKEVAPL